MRILIVTGLTGGHLFPAVTLGDYLLLRNPDWKICYIANARMQEKPALWKVLSERRFHVLEDTPLNSLWHPRVWGRLLINFRRAATCLKGEKPELVIGFGSNLSFAIVLIAWFFGIPVLLHEQNRSLGKANQCLKPFATRIGMSFPLKTENGKQFWCGNFLREPLRQFLQERRGLPSPDTKDVLQLLVMGGSQGAYFINNLVINVLQELAENLRGRLHITILSGEADFQRTAQQFSSSGVRGQVLGFIENVAPLLANADLLLARAGAGTIFESLAFGVPGIWIPFPHSGHQMENAKFLEAKGAGRLLSQEHATPDVVSGLLKNYLSSGGRKELEDMKKKALSLRKIDAQEAALEEIQKIFLQRKKEKI